MSCHAFKSADGSVRGILCLADVYCFEFYTFEWHHYLGPVPVNKRTLEPRTTIPKGFWDMVGRFQKLTKKQREQFRI